MTIKVVGGIYKLVEDRSPLSIGSLIILIRDDKSNAPQFWHHDYGRLYISLHKVEFLGVIENG